jgi:predicted transglutaminase-like cysteine proteinase
MGDTWIAGLGRIATATAIAALLLSLSARQVLAEDVASLPLAPPLPMHAGGTPTTAWKQFCIRLPEECRIDPDEPALVTLTPEVWLLLKTTNKRVNVAIRPKTDREHWGVEDRWNYPDDGYGDCEDFQLLKRRLLIEAGLPRRALRMAVVADKEGYGHAVLMVRSDRGDFILDNSTDAVLAWNETGYRFVKREGSDDLAWVALAGDASTPTVVASRSVAKRRAPMVARRER